MLASPGVMGCICELRLSIFCNPSLRKRIILSALSGTPYNLLTM